MADTMEETIQSMELAQNYKTVKENVTKACEQAGRSEQEVTLLAVSKTKPVDMLMDVYRAGARDFGENKVQELVDKIPQMPSDVRWHMIGHLQRNKVKYIVDKACLIHSVDSVHLAKKIEKEAAKKGVVAKVLLEVNIAQEETKFGIREDEVYALIDAIKDMPHVHVMGLMTIAPFVENPEENRVYFRKMHQLSLDIKSKCIDNIDMSVLSMGMTNDYEIAVEEGATMIRVGTAIFGARNYNI
jgi:pyridoxal phosphate enzyme (YggS family)